MFRFCQKGRNTHWNWRVSPIQDVASEPLTLNTGNVFPSRKVGGRKVGALFLVRLLHLLDSQPSLPPPPSSFPTTPTLKGKKNWRRPAALPTWGLLARILLVPLTSPGLSSLGQGSGMSRAGASCKPVLASAFEAIVSEFACFLVWLL